MANFRKGVSLAVYKREGNKIFYLLLKRKLHWRGWEIPKGGVEPGEKIIQAVKRETREETGLKIKKIRDMKVIKKFKFNKKYKQWPDKKGLIAHLFSVEVSPGEIKLDKREHEGFKWLNFDSAYKKLTWADQKKCLRAVNKNITLKS